MWYSLWHNRLRRLVVISGLGLIILGFVRCSEAGMIAEEQMEVVITPINVPSGRGHQLLSAYNFFDGKLSDQKPNELAGVIPYDLNTELFSDYALKKRFVYVPEGKKIPYDLSSDVLDFPEGSVLIKTFYYKNNDGTHSIIETRLLIHDGSTWIPETYIWDEDQNDAMRSVIGATTTLEVRANGVVQKFNYLIPNQNQCKNCHAYNGALKPVGPTIPNLNKEYVYSDGRGNQITKWINDGILIELGPTDDIPKWSDVGESNVSLNDRARAYLHVNCASCHRREGSAANSGLYLEYSNMDSLSLGFWKTPVAAGDGSGGLSYSIYPGKADQSILLYRMNAEAIDERMPEIGRELLHEEGVQLIRDWIDSM